MIISGAQLREALLEPTEDGPRIYLLVNERQAFALAQGDVPPDVKLMASFAVDELAIVVTPETFGINGNYVEKAAPKQKRAAPSPETHG